MTAKEAIEKYTEMFGGYPAFLIMGMDDAEIVRKLTKCIKEKHELEVEDDGDY